MKTFYFEILNYFLNYISQYSYFGNWDYYSSLFFKYFSFLGYITGFILVLLVLFSSDKDQNKIGFIKVILVIAVINSCSALTSFFYNTFAQGTYVQDIHYNKLESLISAPDNIISGLILTLVISSCYKGYGMRAFFLGVATHSALPLLNFSYLKNIDDENLIKYMVVRIILIGLLCFILSYRKYFFTRWIWYFVFHMFIRIGVYLYPLMKEQSNVKTMYNFKYIINGTLEHVSKFTIDAVIFAIIFVFAIFFEKGVLTVQST